MRKSRTLFILALASAFALAACKSSTYGGPESPGVKGGGESPEKPPAKPGDTKAMDPKAGGESPEKPPSK